MEEIVELTNKAVRGLVTDESDDRVHDYHPRKYGTLLMQMT